MSVLRWHRLAAGLAGLLFVASLGAQFTYPPKQFKDMEARLTVQIAERTVERGVGAATYTLTVEGPESLEVEEPHLGDAASAWKEERQKSTRTVKDERTTWEQIIRLKQSKKGIEALPDVSLRFRDGPGATWEEAKWVDILKRMRELPDPEAPVEEQQASLRRWWFLLALSAAALLILFVWLRKQRRLRREAPLPPDRWALREIERIETTLLPPQSDAETYHTQLSYVMRRYLTERFGLHALQQTTAEFLEAVHQVPRVTAEQQTLLHKGTYQGTAAQLHPRLSAAQQTLLSELFERCDLAKFARASTPSEECQRSAELARQLVRQTTSSAAEPAGRAK